MKIGIIGTIWFNTPPQAYGGTEEVIAELVNGLTARGHEVTFFGPATAKVNATVVPTVDKPLSQTSADWSNVASTVLHLTTAFEQAGSFDIMHFQLNRQPDYFGLPLARSCKTPVVTTLHFQTAGLAQAFPDRFALLEKYQMLPAVSISDAQQQGIPMHFVRTVYNGLDIDRYPFVPTPEDYFVWIGKVKPEKGTKEAIAIAKKAGVKLKLLGVVDQGIPEYKRYFEEEVKPQIDNEQIIWLGEVGMPEKAELLGKARAFINPLQWAEPFGMVMIEAQAAGTPVIAYRKGACPELVRDSLTGFLVEDEEEMVAKIAEVGTLDRRACRDHVQQHFTLETMVKGYEDAYSKTIAMWQQQVGKHTE